MRLFSTIAGVMMFSGLGLLTAADKEDGKPLFNGKDFTGWTKRPDQTDKQDLWTIVGDVKWQEGMPTRLDGEAGTGVLLSGGGGGDGKGRDLMTDASYGDCEVHVEFLMPRGTNSGVFFHGQYELQILDSFGKKDSEVEHRDCGGIYRTAAPLKNAITKPGEWQSYDVIFQAPRFDAAGKKTANAKFVKVVHNGVLIHENVEVMVPNSGASLGAKPKDPVPEKAKGPLMLQATQAPIAFRNIRLKPIGE